jgi:uncharacterized protein
MKSFFILFSFFLNIVASGQKPIAKDLIQNLNQDKSQTFHKYLRVFDTYIASHPTDVLTLIEKCRYIETAQYDVNEEYNPNQNLFDSFSAKIFKLYPTQPDMFLYRIEQSWGEDKMSLFDSADILIERNKDWTDINKSNLYFVRAQAEYYSDDKSNALSSMKKAISFDEKHAYSFLLAQIYQDLKKDKLALRVLNNPKDTISDLAHLYSKANMYLDLKDYKNAMRLFNHIEKSDSSYNNKTEIAKALEGSGQYILARTFLKVDTTEKWNINSGSLQLFLHDLNYQKSSLALQSYNAYRDIGYNMDPFAIYRLKLLFKDPFLAWKFRDILGLITLLGLILLLLIVPYVIVLPVYSCGLKFFSERFSVPEKFNWGLKHFWYVCFAYLMASLMSTIVEPELLKNIFSFENSYIESTEELEAKSDLVYIIFSAIFISFVLYRKKFNIFRSTKWEFPEYLSHILVAYFAYVIVTKIYLALGGLILDNSEQYDLRNIYKTSLSAEQIIKSILDHYGFLIAWFSSAIIVPIYEELIFRGVILHSSQKYIDFKYANFLQASLFALIHQDLFLTPIFLFFGLMAGYLTRKSESLLPSILLHIINNSIVVIALFSLKKFTNL